MRRGFHRRRVVGRVLRRLPRKTVTSHPLGAKQLRLLEYRLHRFVLQVRRIPVFVQNTFHHHANPRPRALA